MQLSLSAALHSAGTMSSPDATNLNANELSLPQEPRRRVSIASDPPTLADGRHSPYFGQETRRRLSVTSSDHQTSDGRRKSILVQHTPDNASIHSQHSGNQHYVNYGFQHDGRFSHDVYVFCDAMLCCRVGVPDVGSSGPSSLLGLKKTARP
jgi:hypothetical protein